jgi:Rad3-related DNA helicase
MTTTTSPLQDYFDALERLKAGKPLHVPKGARITNDAVSQEAQRGKGSIKKSRAVFSDLIQAIDEAAAEQASPRAQERDRLLRAKSEAGSLREQLEAALAREVSLLKELFETRRKLAKLTGENVVPIRGTPSTKSKASA